MHLDPRHLSSANGSPLLADLLDRRSRELIDEVAGSFALLVHLETLDGRPVLGPPIPHRLNAALGEVATTVDSDSGRWHLERVDLDGEPAAVLAVGPFADLPEQERAAGVVARLVRDLVVGGWDRRVAEAVHRACMQDADAALKEQNQRLQEAVVRLQEIDRIKATFLATMSHELRTPLTSILGYSEMLLEGLAGGLNDEQRDYVAVVMEKGEQLLSIINGVLDLSRIEAGRLTLKRSRFSVVEAVQGALSVIAQSARRKGQLLESVVAEGLPELDADREKVRQVLVNLLGNAVKFTPEGGSIRLSVDLGPIARNSGNRERRRGLRVAVTDSGIGIPGEALPKIFDPFFQVDSSTTRRYGGAGLGLAIVQSFVTAHGGTVWVDSQPGQGSTFFVTFPVVEETGEPKR